MHQKADTPSLVRTLLQLLPAILAATAVGATDPSSDQRSVAAPRGPSPIDAPYHVPRATGQITIDGVLDESTWESALVVPLEYETRPGENIDPPAETEALITYDSDALYVGFRAYDPEPEAIRAHLSDRDRAFADDFVGIVLDTFNDERRAFEFFLNPLGVQMDVFKDDVADTESPSWDAIWDSAGKITAEGYVVEFAVPFHQLRFPAANDRQVWGFDAVRSYPRSQCRRFASQPMDRDRDCYLCQISKMEGFEDVSPGRNIELIPTLTAGQTDERVDFPLGPLESGSLKSNIGLTARWGVTPNLTVNATINPDFSQVEADVAQLDINTTFTLFFPERRPFFLEGADFFSTPFRAVFTRNVSDPDWGLKLSGKQGKNAIGVFVAEDTVTNLVFPGTERSDADSFGFASTDAVLRYRRDLGSNSAIGVLFTGRDGGGYSNSVGGFDGLYRLGDSDSIEFQYLRSQTEYPLEISDDYEQPRGSFSDDAYRLRYRHDARNWGWWGFYEEVGDDFRADMGFMPQVGAREGKVGLEHTWWGEEDDWYTQIDLGTKWERRDDQTGQLLARNWEAWASVAGPKQSSFWLILSKAERGFEGITFSTDSVGSRFQISPNDSLYLGMLARVGDAVDFANVRQAETLILEPSIRYNIGKHLRATLNHTFQQLDREEGRLFEANLSQLRLVYQLNIRSFVRAIFQYTAIDRDPTLYDDEVDAETESLFTQLLFSYKINPQTALFVGYTDSREADETISLTQSGRSVFLKFGYAWNL